MDKMGMDRATHPLVPTQLTSLYVRTTCPGGGGARGSRLELSGGAMGLGGSEPREAPFGEGRGGATPGILGGAEARAGGGLDADGDFGGAPGGFQR